MNNPLKEEPKLIDRTDLLDILCESWGFALNGYGVIYFYCDEIETMEDEFSLFSADQGHEIRFKFDNCEAKLYADGLIELTSKLKQKFKFVVLQEMNIKELC